MNVRMKLARELAKNKDLPAYEKARQLNRLTADVRQDYDRQISAIRKRISARRISVTGAMMRTLVGVVTGRRFDHSARAAVIARLRVRLAEVHASKFAAMAELKLLKATTILAPR
jgi:hypothetical protein